MDEYTRQLLLKAAESALAETDFNKDARTWNEHAAALVEDFIITIDEYIGEHSDEVSESEPTE